MNLKKILPVFALSLALAACGGDKINTETKTEDTKKEVTSTESVQETPSNDKANEDMKTSKENMISAKEALEKAKADYADYELSSIGYGSENGEFLYEVNLFKDKNEVELLVNPTSGEVTKKKEEMDDDMHTVLDEKYLDKVDEYLDKALTDASKENSSVEYMVNEWKLEMDDGISLLEIEVYEKDSNKEAYNYKINPEDGSILEKELDD